MSNKRRVKKTVKHTHSYGEGMDKMLSMFKDFASKWEGINKEVVEKHNNMAAQLSAQEQLIKNVANFCAGELGKTQAKLNLWFESVETALHHHDVNYIACAEFLKEILGQLTQVDAFFRKAGIAPELAEADIEEIKKDALEWFGTLQMSAFKKANEEVARQEAEAREKREAEKKRLAEEKEKAAADKAEAERMEAEFQKAEAQDRGTAPATGQAEQESLGLPPDVRVFGMT